MFYVRSDLIRAPSNKKEMNSNEKKKATVVAVNGKLKEIFRKVDFCLLLYCTGVEKFARFLVFRCRIILPFIIWRFFHSRFFLMWLEKGLTIFHSILKTLKDKKLLVYVENKSMTHGYCFCYANRLEVINVCVCVCFITNCRITKQ